MTDTIFALLFLLATIVITMDILPLSDALTAIIQDLPLIGLILDVGSLYEATKANMPLTAYEMLKLANMIILVDLVSGILDFGLHRRVSVRILITVFLSVMANVIMNALLDHVFDPLASSFSSVVGLSPAIPNQLQHKILSSALMLWCFFFSLLLASSFLRSFSKSFSPAIVLGAIAKTIVCCSVVCLIEYICGDTIIQILHGISQYLSRYGGLGFILTIAFSLCCAVLI